MTIDDDNWVKSAMDDTDLVAQLLFKLRHASPPPPQPPKTWSIRQRRSKPPPPPPAAVKKSPPARASPTTPLSWSGATSASGGGGIEESSRPAHDGNSFSRSKANGPSDTTPTKRPRKKKTLLELKEDETTLLRERKQLKRQLATLQARCQKQRMENENLKKIKNDLQSQQQELADGEVNECMEGKKTEGFVLPDLNIPAGEDY